MTTPIAYRYSLDKSGINPDNLVDGEYHDLEVKKYRTVVPHYGPFYADNSLEIIDVASNVKLDRGVDYTCLDMLSVPTMEGLGKQVCVVIVILNVNVGSRIRLKYQTRGGEYERRYAVIKDLIDALLADTRPITWPNVIGRPEEVDPVLHPHSIDATYGYEYLVTVCEQLRQVLIYGDQLSHDQIYAHIDQVFEKLKIVLERQGDSTSVIALARAANAELAANAAKVDLAQFSTEIARLSSKSEQAQRQLARLSDNLDVSQKQALELIASYKAISQQPTLELYQSLQGPPYVPMQFPMTEAIGDVHSETYAIKLDGTLAYFDEKTIASVNPSAFAFIAKIGFCKRFEDGRAIVKLSFYNIDTRVSTVAGKYASINEVTLFPLRLDDGEYRLSEVYCDPCQANFYQYSAQLGNNDVVTYKLIGEEFPASFNNVSPDKDFHAKKIATALMDFRGDYNLSGGFLAAARKGVKLILPTGGLLELNFELMGKSLNDIRRAITLMFKHNFDILKTDDSGVSSMAMAQPSSGKIRCIGVTMA